MPRQVRIMVKALLYSKRDASYGVINVILAQYGFFEGYEIHKNKEFTTISGKCPRGSVEIKIMYV